MLTDRCGLLYSKRGRICTDALPHLVATGCETSSEAESATRETAAVGQEIARHGPRIVACAPVLQSRLGGSKTMNFACVMKKDMACVCHTSHVSLHGPLTRLPFEKDESYEDLK